MSELHVSDKYLAQGKPYYFTLNGFTAWGTLEYTDERFFYIKDTRFYVVSPNGKGIVTEKAEKRLLVISNVVSMVECLEEPKIVKVDEEKGQPADSHPDQENG